MSDNNALIQWSFDIHDRISSNATLAVIPGITEFPRIRSAGNTFSQQVKKVLQYLTGFNGKSGLAYFIQMPGTIGASAKQGSITVNMAVHISIMESRFYNAALTGFAPGGSGSPNLHADDVALMIARHLENWRDEGIADAARVQQIYSDHAGWLPPDVRQQSETFDLYVTAFEVQALASWDLPARCYVPKITFEDDECTLTSATVGATILYTIDGSYPAVANATPYTVPFQVDSGDVIRAVTTLAGYADSDLARGVAP